MTPPRHTRTVLLCVVAGLSAAALAGCTATANLTVSASEVADTAAKALSDQLGIDRLPEMDCGADSVDLVVGEVVDCVLTDPVTTSRFATEVTITKVDGTRYSLDAQVAQTPLP